MNKVRETLSRLGLSTAETLEVFATSTRDISSLTVYRDRLSGVVFIDGFYTGDQTYSDGSYRGQIQELSGGGRDYEVKKDTDRRTLAYEQFYTGKAIAEFGCGDGSFLVEVRDRVACQVGVELQENYVSALKQRGIQCVHSLGEIEDETLDAVFGFHVLEHLPDPLEVLECMKRKLKSGGFLIVEVPHASDFLLKQISSDAFKSFTLWSQHLMLHTRESLRRMVEYSGFEDTVIEGVQRYPLSNHLMWLAEGKPGGHKSFLSAIDTPELCAAYESALRKIDATDTLVAIATKK